MFKTPIVALALLAALPAGAQGWSRYAEDRYGASAEVPPGFEQVQSQAPDAEGLVFRSRDGAILTLSGADVPGSRFEAFVQSQMARDASQEGWNIAASTVTPDWAEYSGSLGRRQLKVRTIAGCEGREAVSARLEFHDTLNPEADRVFRTLRVGPARSC